MSDNYLMEKEVTKPKIPTRVLSHFFCTVLIERNKKPDPNCKTPNEWFTRSFGKRGVAHANFKVSPEIKAKMDDPKTDSFFVVARVVQELNYGARGSVILIHPLKLVDSVEVLQVKESAVVLELEDSHVTAKLKSKELCQYWVLTPTARRELLEQLGKFSIYCLCSNVVDCDLEKDVELGRIVRQSDELLEVLDLIDTY